MADYEGHHHQKETALQALNTIIQLHFEKTLEKKRAIDLQKKELHKLFQIFFIFLSLVFLTLSNSSRLQCRHCWIPISLLSLAHLIFYVSVAQTLRCINAFKYQRRCHKLTLGLATEKLIQLHFEKTLEKKRAIDLQKKELHKLFQIFFIFLSLVFLTLSNSSRLQCRHCWIPISLLSLAHLIFYVSVAQTLRCINAFKYQRRCHKLTLGLATEKLREMKMKLQSGNECDGVGDEEFEIHYQEFKLFIIGPHHHD